ncbi:MAG: class I SAM-dependent methyltransferase [Phycisphaerales bacterium]
MKRGINLGCGKIILPCDRPDHHVLIPEHLYTDPDIQWDNADWNAFEGVNVVVDLFDYPWRMGVPSKKDGREIAQLIPDNTYDYAIASHIAEHIPHHVVERGQFVAHHPLYQDGWFAWFSELWRIMKPGGKAYILVPYAWSNGGISDPTHTRYLTPATFGYFESQDNGSPFAYRMGGRWKVDLSMIPFRPHQRAVEVLRQRRGGGDYTPAPDAVQELWTMATGELNAMVEFMIEMEALKD